MARDLKLIQCTNVDNEQTLTRYTLHTAVAIPSGAEVTLLQEPWILAVKTRRVVTGWSLELVVQYGDMPRTLYRSREKFLIYITQLLDSPVFTKKKA